VFAWERKTSWHQFGTGYGQEGASLHGNRSSGKPPHSLLERYASQGLQNQIFKYMTFTNARSSANTNFNLIKNA